MTQELSQFDDLRVNIQELVAPAFLVQVSDFNSAQGAQDAAKAVKEYSAKIEARRKELVGPLNETVKSINSYAKEIAQPLLQAEDFIKVQLVKFHNEQEAIRLQKKREAEEAERRERERAEQERLVAQQELIAQQEAKLKANDQGAALLGIFENEEDVAIAEAVEQERLALEQKQIELEVLRQAEYRQKQWDIEQAKIKGMRQTLHCEATNLDLVPKHFLVIQLNKAAVLAAARAGQRDIPGVRIWIETTASVGRNSYVPKQLLS